MGEPMQTLPQILRDVTAFYEDAEGHRLAAASAIEALDTDRNELQARLVICRRNIETLMTSADKLEAENTTLRARVDTLERAFFDTPAVPQAMQIERDACKLIAIRYRDNETSVDGCGAADAIANAISVRDMPMPKSEEAEDG